MAKRADVHKLCALHRVRVAQKVRELRERTRAEREATLAHQTELAVQQTLFEQSDNAVTFLAVQVGGKIQVRDIRFASEFATASRGLAHAKTESINKLEREKNETTIRCETARKAWREGDVRLQAIESLKDQYFKRERKLDEVRTELTSDEGFLQQYLHRAEVSK